MEHLQPFRLQAHFLEDFLGALHPLPGIVVAGHIMAVSFMTTGNKDRVRPHLKGLEQVEDIDLPSAGYQDNPDLRRILQAQGARQIGAGIGTPAA